MNDLQFGCASTDWNRRLCVGSEFSQYASKTLVLGHREEIIPTLEAATYELLEEYLRKRKARPKAIVFYRDGVADNQFQKCKTTEVPQIQKVSMIQLFCVSTTTILSTWTLDSLSWYDLTSWKWCSWDNHSNHKSQTKVGRLKFEFWHFMIASNRFCFVLKVSSLYSQAMWSHSAPRLGILWHTLFDLEYTIFTTTTALYHSTSLSVLALLNSSKHTRNSETCPTTLVVYSSPVYPPNWT